VFMHTLALKGACLNMEHLAHTKSCQLIALGEASCSSSITAASVLLFVRCTSPPRPFHMLLKYLPHIKGQTVFALQPIPILTVRGSGQESVGSRQQVKEKR